MTKDRMMMRSLMKKPLNPKTAMVSLTLTGLTLPPPSMEMALAPTTKDLSVGIQEPKDL